ncbi:glycolate oxidase subunit GlcF [Enterovibrio sp. ZSDZ35]|uniref:Glycolate oxidase iron-sulfur subunit n=1 Tax=Enterovibrio qingdaonensis TaxID=2899818 RepID=A0ABT5QFW4_9GAMM|nr:glycolate oxidase subunit GlcF [Enterovibrio sp. ZSDZ35]MDD1779875.1 glycolate oxidase subunit GlcF [Enterovibrio sp. ZSDZ35]
MKTSIQDNLLQTHAGQRAEEILRKCVHCGFCNATCPTYQELNDERDGPRGRIYLIKSMLEGQEVTDKTQRHLDRCLTCRSCETTCPSGVEYSKLLDIGKEHIEKQLPRPFKDRIIRYLLTRLLPHRTLVSLGYRILLRMKPLLPAAYQSKLVDQKTETDKRKNLSNKHTTRTMIGFQGCVQSSLTPETLRAATHVLNHLGINLISVKKEGCCGALNLHLAERERAIKQAKDNINAWWPYIENGAEAIVISASGCGVSIKDYPSLFLGDEHYSLKAKKVASLAKDLSEVLNNEDIESLPLTPMDARVAVHCPCTLQHGLKLKNTYGGVFSRLGVNTVKTSEEHLCCGSAGTYSLLQPQLSSQLKVRKLKALTQEAPDMILTANIGCQLHLNTDSQTPVKHWIEMISERLQDNSIHDR